MEHTEKTTAFLDALDALYLEHKLILDYDVTKLYFVIKDLEGALPNRSNIVDLSKPVEPPTEGLSPDGEETPEPTPYEYGADTGSDKKVKSKKEK